VEVPPPLLAETTVTDRRFVPPVSKSSVISCPPAPSVTGTLTVVQACQAPVAGTVTTFHTLLLVLNPMCKLPPLGEATRICAV
jgi:hypothetical protein